MTKTSPTGTRALQGPVPSRHWRWTLPLCVAIGMGLGFAHDAALGVGPRLDGLWLIAIRIVAWCGVVSLVVCFLRWLLGPQRE